MKFGLFSHVAWPEGTSQKQIYGDKLEQVLFAEEMGFDSAWMAEHHFTRYGIVSSLPLFLTYLAAKTQRIRLGTAVSVLPLHNPVLLAEQLATLDVLSSGRLDVGVGRGFGSEEHRVFRLDRDQTSRMYSEVVDVLVGLWTTPGFSYEGEYHKINEVTLVPEPVQKPHPPVYMAASFSAANVELAVEKRLPITVGVMRDHEPGLSWFPEYRRLAAARGFSVDTSNWPFQRMVHVSETEKEAREAPRDGVMWMLERVSLVRDTGVGSDVHQDFEQWRRTHKSQVTYEHVMQHRAFFGTPKTVAAKIKWLRDEHNIHNFVGHFSTGGMEQSKVLRSMELFAKEVMPQFR